MIRTSPICGCTVESDKLGRVLHLRTCPVCQNVRLDVIRGAEYAGAYVKGGDTVKYVLVKQKDFFST